MTGESVIATMPDKTTATANVLANSRNNDPVRPPWNPMGAYGGERDGHRDDWAERLASCDLGRLDARLPQPHMPLDVFDDHDGIVHD